jgi:hypothetical protein
MFLSNNIILLFILALMIALYYYIPYEEQYITGPNNYMMQSANVLDPTSEIWEAPNMINFPRFINNLEAVTKRRPKWLPNEETFASKYIEGYRPGDWRINGYVTALALEKIRKGKK